ncbi:hypothetical protein GCM10010990_16440 [Croceicoccus mobilis]|uniref:Uncharacterized protein n=1 Tax=Croceicoccus mobilis TaxID=1703339 RepID=A0A916YYY0_9SPHN|nr:hypothetical protein GCM10010990_16440 [Croceicoccus mobilis]
MPDQVQDMDISLGKQGQYLIDVERVARMPADPTVFTHGITILAEAIDHAGKALLEFAVDFARKMRTMGASITATKEFLKEPEFLLRTLRSFVLAGLLDEVWMRTERIV